MNYILVQMEQIKIPGIGTLFPNYFDDGGDYFATFTAEHKPQSLTESNKDGVAYRKGVYLSEVCCGSTPRIDKPDEKASDDHFNEHPTEHSNALYFNLLRCSTNLAGPTEAFSGTDRAIIGRLNSTAAELYSDASNLNHVLAQVYYNANIDGKSRNAKIARHSDKTKDMPTNGLIVFCTFYDWGCDNSTNDSKANDSKISKPKTGYRANPDDKHDILYKNTSVLTVLRFVLKDSAKSFDETKGFPERYDVKLYPNSALFITLETNRFYTHEIIPPNLNAAELPTRLGYVVRCSKTPATHYAGQTYIIDDDYTALQPATSEAIASLKKLYQLENTSAERIEYPNVLFSMNSGDYLAPTRDYLAPMLAVEPITKPVVSGVEPSSLNVDTGNKSDGLNV